MKTNTLSPTCSTGWTPTGALPTICRSGKSIVRQSAAEAAADARDVKRMLLGTGHDPGAEFHLRALEPDHHKIRPRHDLHLRSGHGARPSWATRTSRHVQRDLSQHHQDEADCGSSFFSFHFPGHSSHASPECPGSIHEAASWAIRSAMRSGGVRQSHSRRCLRRRRRRGGNRR